MAAVHKRFNKHGKVDVVGHKNKNKNKKQLVFLYTPSPSVWVYKTTWSVDFLRACDGAEGCTKKKKKKTPNHYFRDLYMYTVRRQGRYTRT